jgi:hypothetical protein
MKKSKFNLIPIFGFLFLSLLISCTSSNKDINTKKKDFSGEELYVGIYFGYGAFSKDIIQFNNRSIKKNFELKIDQLIKEIKRNDSLFFITFKANLSSAKHQLIENEIQNGNAVLQKHRAIFYPKRKNKLESKNVEHNNLLDKNLTTQRLKEYRKKTETLETDIIIDKIAKYYEDFL